MDTLVAQSPTRRKQAERTALSDAKMIDAAVALVVAHGAAGMTLKEVGEAAGYSRAMAGWRFGTKAELCAAVIRAVGEEWLAALNGAVKRQVGVPAIHAALDAHYRFVKDDNARIRAFYILWFDSAGPHPELKQVVAKIHERRQRDVEAWIAGGIAEGTVRADADVTGIAAQFCATIIGIVYQWLVAPNAQRHIKELHEGLKQQMSRALSRD